MVIPFESDNIVYYTIPFCQFQIKFINSNSIFYLLQSLIGVGTLSTYLKYQIQVVYIPSRIVMEEIFYVKLICGFNVFVANFNSKCPSIPILELN